MGSGKAITGEGFLGECSINVKHTVHSRLLAICDNLAATTQVWSGQACLIGGLNDLVQQTGPNVIEQTRSTAQLCLPLLLKEYSKSGIKTNLPHVFQQGWYDCWNRVWMLVMENRT